MKEIASAEAWDLSTKTESLQCHCSSSHRLCCHFALNHSITLMLIHKSLTDKKGIPAHLFTVFPFQIQSFVQDLGTKRYFVLCSCVNCPDCYWAEIHVWEDKASSHHHCIMEAICTHYIRLLWRAPENQRLINAFGRNLLAAVQVAFHLQKREREKRGRERERTLLTHGHLHHICSTWVCGRETSSSLTWLGWRAKKARHRNMKGRVFFFSSPDFLFCSYHN